MIAFTVVQKNFPLSERADGERFIVEPVSPIDLIPDFVPVLGYLDDLILIPVGIALVIKLVPDLVLTECRIWAQEVMQIGKPVSRVAGAVIVVIWLALAALCVVWSYEALVAQ